MSGRPEVGATGDGIAWRLFCFTLRRFEFDYYSTEYLPGIIGEQTLSGATRYTGPYI